MLGRIGMPSTTLNSTPRTFTPFTLEEVFRIAEGIDCDPIPLLSDTPKGQRLVA